MIGLGLAVLALTLFTLLPRWKRHRVRVTGVARVRSAMKRYEWPALTPLTPVDGIPSPRNEPSAGPQQPDAVLFPPTRDSARCRRTVPLSDLSSLNGTVSPGWRFR